MYLNISYNYQLRAAKSLVWVSWAEPHLRSSLEWLIIKTHKSPETDTGKVSGKVKSLDFFLNGSKPSPSTISGSVWPLKNPPEKHPWPWNSSSPIKSIINVSLGGSIAEHQLTPDVSSTSADWTKGSCGNQGKKGRDSGWSWDEHSQATPGELNGPWEAVHTQKSNFNYLWSLMDLN